MILYLSFILTVFCQIISTSSAVAVNGVEEATVATSILTEYVSTQNGLLKIHQSQTSWNDARNICLDEGAQLAIIDSAPKEAMVLKFMKENNINAAWIGVHDLFEKKQWTTIKGDRLYTLGYVHWRNGEPNGASAGEHCVELHHTGMNDMPCDAERSFICERNGIDIRSL